MPDRIKIAENEQGRLQGPLGAMTSLAGLIAPILYTRIFAFAIGAGHDVLPAGTHMYLAATFLALGAVLAFRYLNRRALLPPTAERGAFARHASARDRLPSGHPRRPHER